MQHGDEDQRHGDHGECLADIERGLSCCGTLYQVVVGGREQLLDGVPRSTGGWKEYD
jgi:hypothetical protein